MQKTEVTQEQIKLQSQSPPSMVEILGVYVITFFTALLFFHFSNGLFPDQYGPLVSIASHIPMLIIPWIWFHFRVRVSIENAILWKWTKRSFKPLLLICSWLIPLQILGNLDLLGKSMPEWYQNGAGSIALQFLFQGMIVGFTEEMFMRPAIHQTLLSKPLGGFRLGQKIYLSTPLFITAVLFGLLHVGNIGHQPIGYTLFQVVYSFVIGIIFGFYYERTRNYVATSILHNLLDVVAVIMVLLVGLLR